MSRLGGRLLSPTNYLKKSDIYDMFGLVENCIGTPGQVGFGVGICPPAKLPDGFTPLDGYSHPCSPNYGNYQFRDGSIMVWIPKFYYRLPAIQANISAATQANPCQVTTSAAHGLVTGDKIFICNVSGMTQLNNAFYTVTKVDDTNVTLDGVNSTGYTAYTSGGQIVLKQGTEREWNATLVSYQLNAIDVVGTDVFSSTAAANAEGYALHRAFIDCGVEQDGFFVDKYLISKKAWGAGYIGSSIKNGNPISTSSAHNPIADLTASGGNNNYYAMLDVAKARDGVDGAKNANSIFFCCSRFIHMALAMLSLAHGQVSQGDTFCAWYHASYNFPKGCNNGVLKDSQDSLVTYVGDGYVAGASSICGKTGSGTPFAKTTHNGQECGVADLNGLMFEIAIGMTCIASGKSITAATQANPCQVTVSSHGYNTGDVIMITSVSGMTQLNDKLYKITVVDADNFTLDGVNSTGYGAYTSGGTATKGTFYAAKQATAMKEFTSGNTLATDHWGAAGVAAMMDALAAETVASMFKTTGGGVFAQRYGSGTYQVLGNAASGEEWVKTGLGLVKSEASVDTSGTNLFGQDYYYQYILNELCLLSGGGWATCAGAGVWAAAFASFRSYSDSHVGGRLACYPL
ncbi:MAG: ubiquitin-activating E1 FCCH domain-containing protein [Pseudomonadota bacterium]